MMHNQNLPTDLASWRFKRIQDGDPKFGISVTAETGRGDMTFGFEVTTLDPASEQWAIDYGFPEIVVKHAMRILNP
jgi:hypothetical protein